MATVTVFFMMDCLLLLLLPLLASTAQGNQGCDGPSSLGGKSGNITSSNFPRAYRGNTVCEWIINVPLNRLVKLTFVDFELEGGRNCNYDYVEVRDGHLPFAPLLGKYCGNKTTFHVFSTSHYMFVRFKSDNSLNKKGFHAIFTAVVTKGNECEKHWHYFEDSVYKFCDIPTTKWIVAQKTCQDMGADLVKLSTERENTFVYKIQKSLEFQSSWLGLTRSADNTFYWSDGTSLNYTKWRPSEPSQDGDVRKDCTELIGGYWRNVRCDKTHEAPQFVCEKKNYVNKCQRYPLLSSSEASTKTVLTASSYKDLHHNASDGVLSNTRSIWCPGSNTAQEWIQVDLGKLHFICGVAAVNNVIMNNRTAVTWYRVYSFVTRPDDSSKMKSGSQEFHTNTAVYKADIRDFQRIARYLRFVSTRSREWPCMRIEVYGEGKEVPRLQMSFPIGNKTVDATVVSSTSFRCLAFGYPSPSYTWFKDGAKVIPNRILSEQNSLLQLTRLDLTSKGWYTCTATNVLGSVNSTGYLMVTMNTIPAILQGLPSRTSIMKGNGTLLLCEGKANAKPLVTWFKNGQPVKENGRVTIMESGNTTLQSTLRITNTDYRDGGVYKCVFNGTGGTVFSNGTVVVQDDRDEDILPGKPRIDTNLTRNEISAIISETIEVRCFSSSSRPLKYSWKINGITVQGRSNLKVYNNVLILTLKKPRDFGVYACHVTNMAGSAIYNITVVQTKNASTHPAITTPHEARMSVVRGRSADIHCRTTGNPTPKLEWWKDGVRLLQTARVRFQNDKQVVKISRLEKQDSGLYECVATNVIGTVTARNNVSVFGEPAINTDLTKAEVTTSLGISASIKCFASNPLPVRYYWTKNMAALHNTENIRVYNNLLVVTPSDLEDFGVYVCHLTNIAGYTNYSISLVQFPGENNTSVLAKASGFPIEDVGIILAIAIPVIVVILVVLAVVIVHFYRRSRHK